MSTVRVCFGAALAALLCISSSHADDMIVRWNNVIMDTIRATGGPPCPISRTQAMVHVAMYEAVNSVHRTHAPYTKFIECPAGTSSNAAAAVAAHRVLTSLYPTRKAIYDSALASSLATVPNGHPKTEGIKLGEKAAQRIMVLRSNDGSSYPVTYKIGNKPGDWRPTYPDYNSSPATPGWGNTTPWTLWRSSLYRPQGPLGITNMAALLKSQGYANQLNEVKSLGAKNSTTRTAEQTRIAFFWANDLDGTYKPPGHLNVITQTISKQKKLGMKENARLFALLNLALGDAGITAWDSKYNTDIDLWRPISAIRMAAEDGNDKTVADPKWESLNPFQPTFPAYVSGHATFGAAHAAVMAEYFGSDSMTFTITSEDPFYQKLCGIPRTYTKFSDAAWDNAISRIYLGVHFRFDATDGNKLGMQVGQNAARRFLRPIKRVDLDGDGQVCHEDSILFSSCYAKGEAAADMNGDGKVTTLDKDLYTKQFDLYQSP